MAAAAAASATSRTIAKPRSLMDVTSHYLIVAILQDEDVPTICAMSRVSKEFCVAARQALSLVQSVSITGTDTAWKLAIIRTVTRHCVNLRQISAHFVDDLPKEVLELAKCAMIHQKTIRWFYFCDFLKRCCVRDRSSSLFRPTIPVLRDFAT